MIVAISATGPELTSCMDPRFGRCPYFQIIETNTLKVLEVIPNTAATAVRGVGIQAAQLLINKGVRVIISRYFEPNAYQILTAAGVQCVAGENGTVSETIARYCYTLWGISSVPLMSHTGMENKEILGNDLK